MNTKIIPIRYWLLGHNFHTALSALEFANKFHTGTRKDKCTPEFDHQLIIAGFIRTLGGSLDYPEETIAAAFLHDVCEDYDVGFDEIDTKFGRTIRDAVICLTKKHRGIKLTPDTYYSNMAGNAIASVIKGVDRMHNMQTMHAVFNEDKQNNYIAETTDYILPMLKQARRTFTKQEPVYENIKLVLNSQIELIKIALSK